MSRLVDIDDERFWDVLFDEACVEGNQAERIKNELEKIVAFDTEKVVEKLEEEGQKMAEAKPTKPYGKSGPSCHRYYKAISVKKAIDIVKKGGVE